MKLVIKFTATQLLALVLLTPIKTVGELEISMCSVDGFFCGRGSSPSAAGTGNI